MVFVPLYDDNHLKFIPFQYATWTLIAVNVAVGWRAGRREAAA